MIIKLSDTYFIKFNTKEFSLDIFSKKRFRKKYNALFLIIHDENYYLTDNEVVFAEVCEKIINAVNADIKYLDLTEYYSI